MALRLNPQRHRLVYRVRHEEKLPMQPLFNYSVGRASPSKLPSNPSKHMESRNEGREAISLSLYISYLAEICFVALSMPPVSYVSPQEPNRVSLSLPFSFARTF
ncbi:hypothetical protein AVEN_12905-1 [Araneus ventricosus]|uniref:Uncharacterized protein n=1 Tax=Araneus ventricosus TaxID=182803 RepID=A0A4Y2N6Z4_ARAVE|nr:hypothetical protein AVEN_12905-1 [Araneus ventricosus]